MMFFFWGGCDPSRDFRLAGGSIMLFQLSQRSAVDDLPVRSAGIFWRPATAGGEGATVAMFRHRDNYDKLDKTAPY